MTDQNGPSDEIRMNQLHALEQANLREFGKGLQKGELNMLFGRVRRFSKTAEQVNATLDAVELQRARQRLHMNVGGEPLSMDHIHELMKRCWDDGITVRRLRGNFVDLRKPLHRTFLTQGPWPKTLETEFGPVTMRQDSKIPLGMLLGVGTHGDGVGVITNIGQDVGLQISKSPAASSGEKSSAPSISEDDVLDLTIGFDYQNVFVKHGGLRVSVWDLAMAFEECAAEGNKFHRALDKINEIRNSIIGAQTINWSEHIYPLVAALEEAGIEGMNYPEARKNFGTMLERTNKAEAEVKRLRALLEDEPSKADLAADQDLEDHYSDKLSN